MNTDQMALLARDGNSNPMHHLHKDQRLSCLPLDGFSLSKTLHAFYAAALQSAKAAAVWRLPGSGEISAVVDLGQVNELTHINFHRRRAGFVFAPFVGGDQNAAYRIDADAVYTPAGLLLPDPGDNEPRRQAQQQFAAALAALLAEKDRMQGKRAGVILSGGNIDLALFQDWVLGTA